MENQVLNKSEALSDGKGNSDIKLSKVPKEVIKHFLDIGGTVSIEYKVTEVKDFN